jgi:hypothetical protein
MATSLGHGVAEDRADGVLEQVRSIARGLLDDHYGDGFATDIEVHREESMADDEHDTYLDITIAFDAEDPKDCEPAWLATFLTELRTSLMERGIEEFPVPSYLLKSEWDQIKEGSGPVQAG